MTHHAIRGDSEDQDVKPLQQENDGTENDDEGGKEIIPDSDVPGTGEAS